VDATSLRFDDRLLLARGPATGSLADIHASGSITATDYLENRNQFIAQSVEVR
jgi:hypothetical protein